MYERVLNAMDLEDSWSLCSSTYSQDSDSGNEEDKILQDIYTQSQASSETLQLYEIISIAIAGHEITERLHSEDDMDGEGVSASTVINTDGKFGYPGN
jgi:hypothetical protein